MSEGTIAMAQKRQRPLAQRLCKLPEPQKRTSPRAAADGSRRRGDHDLNPEFYRPAAALRQAAVLVPIVEHAAGASLLLTRRTAHLKHHSGQISFPGGRCDAQDRSPEDTALREAEEEIGLQRSLVSLAGRLDTYVTRTGFNVVPVIGLLRPPLTLTLQESEVESAFEVPLAFFLNPSNRRIDSRLYSGKQRHFYAYPCQGYYVWGATAGMINNLAEVLNAAEEG